MSTNFQNQDSPFSANGRFGRLSYLGWNMLLGLVLVLIVTSVILVEPNLIIYMKDSMTSMIFFGILYLIVIYFSLIFTIRRLHDLDQSGWLSLVTLIPVINLFFFLYLIFAPGTQGSNNYGAPRMTKTWEKVLGWMYGLVPILGILAAISLPAYQSYVERAKLQQIEQQVNQSE